MVTHFRLFVCLFRFRSFPVIRPQPVLHVLPLHSQRVHPTCGVLRSPRGIPRTILRQREFHEQNTGGIDKCAPSRNAFKAEEKVERRKIYPQKSHVFRYFRQCSWMESVT